MLLFSGFGACACLYVIASYMGQHANERALAWFLLSIFGPMLVASIAMVVISMRSYVLYDHGLKAQTAFGERTIQWVDIKDADFGTGHPDANIQISLRDGSRLSIAMDLFEKQAPELREALLLHTAAIRVQQLKNFDRAGGSLPFNRSKDAIGIPVMLTMFAGMRNMAAVSGREYITGPLVYFDLFGVLLLLLFVWAFSRRYVWSEEGMGSSSLFGKRWFRWEDITQVSEQAFSGRTGTSIILTIRTDACKIQLSSAMPSYQAVKQMVIDRTGKTP
jgi:hypothetical protein